MSADDYEQCEDCGAVIIEDSQGRQYCKLCGWCKKDPTLTGEHSYIG